MLNIQYVFGKKKKKKKMIWSLIGLKFCDTQAWDLSHSAVEFRIAMGQRIGLTVAQLQITGVY